MTTEKHTIETDTGIGDGSLDASFQQVHTVRSHEWVLQVREKGDPLQTSGTSWKHWDYRAMTHGM